jgi:excisionase family DNA binding protein
MERLYSTAAAARVLHVDPSTLRRWVASGRVRPAAVTAGGHARFSRQQLDALADSMLAGSAFAQVAHEPRMPQAKPDVDQDPVQDADMNNSSLNPKTPVPLDRVSTIVSNTRALVDDSFTQLRTAMRHLVVLSLVIWAVSNVALWIVQGMYGVSEIPVIEGQDVASDEAIAVGVIYLLRIVADVSLVLVPVAIGIALLLRFAQYTASR